MLRALAFALLVTGAASSSFAADLGKADGSMTTDKTTTVLTHAYAVRKVHNDSTNKNDAISDLQGTACYRAVDAICRARIIGDEPENHRLSGCLRSPYESQPLRDRPQWRLVRVEHIGRVV